MSEWRWRALTLEMFPELRKEIKRARSAHGVFFELLPALEQAYRAVPADEDRIRRIYTYASWCLAPEQHRDEYEAALASFYEHLPDLEPAWRDLPRRATPRELSILREHLRRYLDPPEFARVMAELDAAAEALPTRPAV
ncbi:MAG: hypothetical protein ACRDIC_08695 [bacterium]